MSPEATPSLAICSGSSERGGRILDGKRGFTLATIAVSELFRTLVVSAGQENDAITMIRGFARKMAAIVHPLLTLLASLTRQKLAQ